MELLAFAIEERGSLAVGVVVFADFDIGVERPILFKSALPSEQVKSKGHALVRRRDGVYAASFEHGEREGDRVGFARGFDEQVGGRENA